MSSAVINGRISHLSASQISTFDPLQSGGCPRKWFYEKIKRLPKPENKSQAIGTKIHNEIEHYLKTGENILSREALSAQSFLPEPQSSIWVEHSLNGFTLSGIDIEGRIDLVSGFRYIDSDKIEKTDPPYTLEVLDWKTGSTFDYCKTGAQLIDTVQMPLYAWYLAERFPLQGVRLSHVYIKTKGKPDSKKATQYFTIDKIQERIENIKPVIEQMKQVATCQNAEDVTPNYNACMAFRGCPYANVCPRSTQGIIQSLFGEGTGDIMTGKQESLLETLRKKKAGATVPSNPALEEEKQRILQEERSLQESPGVKAFAPIVPPDIRPIEGKDAAEPIPDTLQVASSVKASAARMGLLETSDQGQLGLGSKGFTPPAKAAEPKTATFVKPETKEEKKRVLNLFVDCLVQSKDFPGDILPFAPILDEVLADLQQEYKTPDIRIMDEGPLSYGKWKGVLRSKIQSLDLQGNYVLFHTQDSEFKQIVVEALESRCMLLVTGRG